MNYIMALISRICFLSNRLFSGGALLNSWNISLQNRCYHKFLNNLSTKSTAYSSCRYQSNDTESKQKLEKPQAVSQASRLKQAVRDYGATIIVFHVAISLTSLGICYIAISNGVDAVLFMRYIGVPESFVSSNVVVGSSTFVMAYALHKLFAPARIAITLSAAPFIVRYLRRINVLKPPKQKH